MNKFRVTLNFNMNVHDAESGWSSYEESRTEKKAKEKAFARTDAYYEVHDLKAYVKSFSAMELVENMPSQGEVLSAEWDPAAFQIHMIVKTDQDADDLRDELEMNSLEDGEYEACGETGWILFTRDPEGKTLGPPWDMKNFWEYALLDYRDNPIVVTPCEEEEA
jgi:hypothetical protein